MRYRLHIVAEGNGAHADLGGVNRIDRQRRFDPSEAILACAEDQLEAVIARRDFKLVFAAERVLDKAVELLAGIEIESHSVAEPRCHTAAEVIR